jgi:serine/threonine protein kinase
MTHIDDRFSGSTFYLSPECQGGLFSRLTHYGTANNDIWALGVILVNLTCGRNPWRQACPSDETFRAFVHDPDFLRTILPISSATNRILKGIFALEPSERMTLRELRRAIVCVETFTMTEEELRGAHSAATVRPIPAPAPQPQPVIEVKVIQPEPEIELGMVVDESVYYDQNQNQPHMPNFSTASAFDIEPSLLDQIDFAQPITQVSPAIHNAPRIPTTSTFGIEPLVPNSSRSSSSGDGDISLPPTPEFNPACDKVAPGGVVPKWDLAGKIAPPRPDLLHVNTKHTGSTYSSEFSYI